MTVFKFNWICRLTVALVFLATGNLFSQPETLDWKFDFNIGLQVHDERIVLFEPWATGAGVYQTSFYISRLINPNSKFQIYSGAGISVEHMTTIASFNGELFEGIDKERESINRYTKAIFLVNTDLNYHISKKYAIQFQILPQLGVFRKVRNTRETSNSIDFSGFDLFYNDTELNLFFVRKGNSFDFKIGYRLTHFKVDKALFFDAKHGNENIPESEWVHNNTFDTVNPLKLFFGFSRKF